MLSFFRSLWPFVRPHRNRLILGLAFGVVYAATSGALMFLVKLVVNLVFPESGHFSLAEQIQKAPEFLHPLTEPLLRWVPELKSPESKIGKVLLVCTLPLLMLIRAVAGYLNVYLTNWAAVRAIADLRVKLFDHLQNLPLSFFSTARTGDLIARVINNTQSVNTVITTSAASLMKDPLTILALLGLLLSQRETRNLTLISVVVLPVCLVPITIYAKKSRKSARAVQSHLAELSNLMHEAFTGNRIIKAYNLENTVLEQFRQGTRKYISDIMRIIRGNEIPSQMTEFMGVVGVALVLVYVIFQTHPITPGDFVSFVVSIIIMYQPIKTLIRIYNQMHQAAAASQHVFELLAISSTIVEPLQPVPLQAAGADIIFQNVDFDYGDKPVLRNINLTVKAGQLVALVGSSGSGKTTLTNLLLRFYDPKRGAVLIGGTDVRQLAIKDLRRNIALVAQETILFNDTIRHNIALGRPGASDAEIEAPARHAFAHDFIIEKPQGYRTVVGEKGAALSGGQRQRIAIARALLKDAPILVLDEALNALDAESERIVQAALEGLMQGRTTICIAHRLSTIQKADVIVVMNEGRIVETGTHTELLQARGYYCKLYELQFESVPVPA